MRVLIVGSGSGAAACAVELVLAGHEVRLIGRSEATLAPFRQMGIAYRGVLGEGSISDVTINSSIRPHVSWSEAAVVSLPTFAHAGIASALASAGWPVSRPVILNPGHTGGALEFAEAFRKAAGHKPCVAEFATLSYVARKYKPHEVTITGRAKSLRAAALPGCEAALAAALALFPGSYDAKDVLATGLANVNMVLHPPGCVLGAAWVEARRGDFTFYVDAMTPGVARVMAALDDERRNVASAFGHALPNLVDEMKFIGTVSDDADPSDFHQAISAGEANARIKAPDSLEHRYYEEDFGYGLLPFLVLAQIADVPTPVAHALLTLGRTLVPPGRTRNRDASSMGIEGMDRRGLLKAVHP